MCYAEFETFAFRLKRSNLVNNNLNDFERFSEWNSRKIENIIACKMIMIQMTTI